jgi:hypothetical protein
MTADSPAKKLDPSERAKKGDGYHHGKSGARGSEVHGVLLAL